MWAACSARIRSGAVWVALVGAVASIAVPAARRSSARAALMRRLDRVALAPPPGTLAFSLAGAPPGGPLLASWQTVGGCGAGAASGGGVGVKWIGRNVSGGLFNVQSQASYTRVHSTYLEDQLFVNNLITKDVGEKWQLGVNVPIVYKYLRDPYGLNVDLSNSGLGDVNLQAMRRYGAINDTLFTLSLGLPTGKYDQLYKNAPLDGSSVPLLTGKWTDKPDEPVAWTHTYKGGRVFYTSLGHPDDFKQPQFRRLLLNAVLWASDRAVPKP